ncbi:5-(carboxyamino)imidazole ribonucleotide synthase [Hazenella sp. IB182353]|uniref:5-(carboxyamino)imidazole ribonucleotide synthase n=1 Tax=Polycladospora coralii TaxID=2771432 RepID=UPI001746A7B7|nr:5-(carboxyamino)imidazole ribonucleotide synthase [Polycladospora coralii]MBS7531652.1 5-(carboxyamino)imidazole ribonucleotide synthase [Polycladospora coralii]
MTLVGKTIGILGGGQLGRMIILEGRKMGLRFITLDPAKDCPAAQVADEHIVAGFDDLEAATILGEKTDIILYEFENIDINLVRELEKSYRIPQSSRLLEITGNRLLEKQALTDAGVRVAPYQAIETHADMRSAWHSFSAPAILKTVRGGYDGKGQWRIHTSEEMSGLPHSLFGEDHTYIMEQYIPFRSEISVIVSRGLSGEMKVFPPALNVHRNHILHLSIAPAPLKDHVIEQAEQMARQIASYLNLVGILAIEMFVLEDDTILVNELAPRPHNSGHYTYDACRTSQFEQVIRAVTGMVLGQVMMHESALMVNVLGEHTDQLKEKMNTLPTTAKLHWYGKSEAKKGRKMGHLTFVGDSIDGLISQMEQIAIWPQLTNKEKQQIGILSNRNEVKVGN